MTEKDFYVWAGKKIRDLREKANITQEELSQQTGIDRTLISKFENTGKKISAFRIKQILETMGYTLADLTDKKKLQTSSSMAPA